MADCLCLWLRPLHHFNPLTLENSMRNILRFIKITVDWDIIYKGDYG